LPSLQEGENVRYRIEFLSETAEEVSVCHAADTNDELEIAEMRAFLAASRMRRNFGAEGFQIRDLTSEGRIVMLEMFDEPLGRYSPDSVMRPLH
jgi:hypothetical protein